MEIREYKNIFNFEGSHYYYVSTHKFIFKLIQNFFPKNRTLRILDAGCGTGLLIKKMEKYGQVWGVDISSQALRYCHKRGIKNVKLGSVTKLPLKNNFFDLVVCLDVLYHKKVQDDRKALFEFYRVLKPGGILILKLPAFNFLMGRHDKLVHTRHRYTTKEIENKLINQGFEIEKSTYAFIIFLPIIFIKRLLERFLSAKPSSDIWKPPVLINNLLTKIMDTETTLLLKHNIPLGVTLFTIAKKAL